MVREKIQIRTNEYAAILFNSKINAIKQKDILQTGYRVYDDGKIGLRYIEGDADDEKMFKEAEERLSLGIKYGHQPEKDIIRSVDFAEGLPAFDRKEFVDRTEVLVEELRKELPDFHIANGFYATEKECSLINDQGLDLRFRDRYYTIELILYDRQTINIFDGAMGFRSRDYNPEYLLNYSRRVYENRRNEIKIKDGEKYPVIVSIGDFNNIYFGFVNTCFEKELNAKNIAEGGSIFAGKVGEKLFSDIFSFTQFRTREDSIGLPFFDAEGVIVEGGRVDFIKDGVLQQPYTDRELSKKYGYPLTGSAEIVPKSIPGLVKTGYGGIPVIKPDGSKVTGKLEKLDDLLGGDRAIFVDLSLGGAYDSMGGYSMPIQRGFVYENGEFVGVVKELMGNSTIADMYGKDYRGLAENEFMPGVAQDLMVIDMKLQANE